MGTTLFIASILVILLSVLPFVPNQHWVYRVPDFLKLQLFFLKLLIIPLDILYWEEILGFYFLVGALIALLLYHAFILMRYTKFWRKEKKVAAKHSSEIIKIISCNIYQFNTEYERFIDLIKREKPHIFLTMESNSDWEKAMRTLEEDYPTQHKVTLENTYGMHFYSRLPIRKIQTHYFVADDLPSIEAEVETEDGYRFVFFGVHPPPPSPTEEATSKERDGDLLSVAKRVREYKMPVVVIGDFNNVAWAKTSILFKNTSQLIDARIGRGILSTFHAKYWFFRVPLDLLFHSPSVFIEELNIAENVGSDHFPVQVSFRINEESAAQEEDVKDLDKGEMSEVNELIKEGKKEESDNREELAEE